MRRWISKQEEKKEYHTSAAQTDYNIPLIGYRGALFICLVIVLVVLVVPYLFSGFGVWVVHIISSILIGFGISFSQHFIHSRKKICRSFWVVGALFSIVSFILLAMIQ
ncbi:hypothetical protein NHG28_04630 [Aerococcaceae bacterium NML201209]|nr:hypothetical protein [Aerococcaceae bacterium NML201209]MCW6667339.1 hypothetical protein [Aerococcaceae bacterium NML190938]